MIKNIITSVKLRVTYRTNAIIYSFKTIPFIGKYIPDSIYGESALKLLFTIIYLAYRVLIRYFLLYVGYLLIVWFISSITTMETSKSFLIIFAYLSILFGVFNPFVLKANIDSDYAVNGLQMSAKRYLLDNYYYQMVIMYAIFVPTLLIIFLIIKLPLYLCLLLPFVHISIKNITTFVKISNIDNKKKYYLYETLLTIVSTILVVMSYLYLNNNTLIWLFVSYILLFSIFGIISLIKLGKIDNYRKVFKSLFNKRLFKKNYKEEEIKMISNTISDVEVTSDKKGYDFFHELFVKRHAKILSKTIINYCIVTGIIVLLVIVITIFNPMSGESIKNGLNKFALYFLAIMYMINRGEKISKAMFMNCDHAMLTYRIYRSPKVILALFKRRLLTLIRLNIIPASMIAVGSIIVFIISGNINITNIIFFPLSILLLSVFFSVHNLVLYYLLQPYNVNTEERSKSYRIANIITYFVCIYPAFYLDVELDVNTFSYLMIFASIIYIFVGLYLVQKYAPRTFKNKL